MTLATPKTANDICSAFHHIQRNAAVLFARVRGDVSRSVVRQIQEDANAGLAALHNLAGAMSETPVQQAEHVPDLEHGAVEAPTQQPDIASMIRMLLNILANVDHGSDELSINAHRAAVETVQNLAIALGVANEVVAHTANEPANIEESAQPDAAEGHDGEGWIELADAICGTGAQLADEDLLSAVHAAIAIQDISYQVVIGLENVHRRVGHCHLLFDQIHEGAQRSSSPPGLGQFADIGRDIATEVQDECLSLLRLLEDASKEENHG